MLLFLNKAGVVHEGKWVLKLGLHSAVCTNFLSSDSQKDYTAKEALCYKMSWKEYTLLQWFPTHSPREQQCLLQPDQGALLLNKECCELQKWLFEVHRLYSELQKYALSFKFQVGQTTVEEVLMWGSVYTDL
jgi:hypothetical protein